MAWIPLLVGVYLAVLLGLSILALLTRRQHPWRIVLRTLSGASILAILGIVGIMPAELWWLPWLLTLLLAVAAVVACRRLLTPAPSTELGRRAAADLTAPTRSTLIVEGLLYLALLVLALVAG